VRAEAIPDTSGHPVALEHLPQPHARQARAAACVHEQPRRASLADQRRPAIPKVALQPGHGFVADRHEALLAPLPARRQEPALEVHVGHLECDKFRHAESRGVEHFDERAVAKAPRNLLIGLCEQPVHFLD